MKFNCRTILLKKGKISEKIQGINTKVTTTKLIYDLDSAQSHSIKISFLRDILVYLRSLLSFVLWFLLGIIFSLILLYFIMAIIYHDFLALTESTSWIPAIITWLIAFLFGILGIKKTFVRAIERKAIKERSIHDNIPKDKIKAVLESRWKSFNPVEIASKQETQVEKWAKCGRCGKLVNIYSKAGDRCPHCNVKWDLVERKSFR